MGNMTGGGFEVALDPIDQALIDRDHAGRVLIVGAGARCAQMDDDTHHPHPHGSVTLDLPPQSTPNYQRPSVHGDITNTHDVVWNVLHHQLFDLVHFENVDIAVCCNVGAIAAAHALLAPGGTLLIETGGVRAQQTVSAILPLLQLLGFTNIYYKTTTGVQIVARKGSGLSGVRIVGVTPEQREALQ